MEETFTFLCTAQISTPPVTRRVIYNEVETAMRTLSFQSLFVVMFFFAYPCLGQTDLQSDPRQGVKRNPPGVTVTLRAAEGKASFHLFEPIPIELVFQSTHPSSYSIELNEHMNFAGKTNWFQISPVETVYLTPSQKQVRLVECCAIDRRYLSPQPLILKRELTDYFRFESPGTYSVYYATERVFRGFGKHNDFGTSQLELTSNVMTITILPDDPDWDAEQLASALQKLQDPAVKARYNKVLRHPTNLHSDFYLSNYVAQTEFVRAQKALNVLDTEQAIRERIRLRTTGSQHDIDVLSSTARPALIADRMRERAEAPDFASTPITFTAGQLS